MVWDNPGAYDILKKKNPDIIKRVDKLGHILKVNNLLAQCEELGLTIDSNKLDVETIQLCYQLRMNLKKNQSNKKDSKQTSGGIRGRR